jgi:hypothetical protein
VIEPLLNKELNMQYFRDISSFISRVNNISLLRRMVKGVSIYNADTAHLHLKLFHFFRPQPHYKKIANALVTPALSGLWLFPLLAITWVYHKPFFIWIAVILFIAFYGLLYVLIPNAKKNKNS